VRDEKRDKGFRKKEKIIFENDVIFYLRRLIHRLYLDEYFYSIVAREDYVERIIDYINENIEQSQHKKAPTELFYLGEYYMFYNANSSTTWFIFFYRKNNDFLISGILNNHVEESNRLNQ